MRVIPGTPICDQVPHRDTFASDNLLIRGQEIDVEVDSRKAVDRVASLARCRCIMSG